MSAVQSARLGLMSENPWVIGACLAAALLLCAAWVMARADGRRVGGMVLRELAHRRASALFTLSSIALAVALIVFFQTLARAGEHQTRVLQRDLGLNVLVLSAEEDLDRYWTLGHAEHSLPAAYVERLAEQDVANRLVPLLRKRVEWMGAPAVLVGIAPEIFKRGQSQKRVFGREVEPGTLVVGGALARARGLSEGQAVPFMGERFEVATVLGEAGRAEDAWVFAALPDAQRLLGMEGRINEIQAIECHCSEEVLDPLAHLRAQLEPLLPGTQVVRRRELADARREQRLAAERYLGTAVPAAILICAFLVAVLAAQNARERRSEVGLLRALGYGGRTLGGLLLGRLLLLGFLGALVGVALGRAGAHVLGASVYPVAKSSLALDPWLALACAVGAPLFAALAGLVPTAIAATEDPARVLAEDVAH